MDQKVYEQVDRFTSISICQCLRLPSSIAYFQDFVKTGQVIPTNNLKAIFKTLYKNKQCILI